MSANTFEDFLTQFGEIESIPRSRFQKVVAKTMTANSAALPHVTHHDVIDVTDFVARRQKLEPGDRHSPLIHLIKALTLGLADFPHFNASLSPDGETLFLKKYFNIGIAVDGPLGLLVPVIRGCDGKDLAGLAAELKEVSAQARAKGLSIDKMSGGCMTISSLGGIGGHYFTPIINAPEVAILGVTGIRIEPFWDGEAFVPRSMLPCSLSYDHRVINGADAARFVRRVGNAFQDASVWK